MEHNMLEKMMHAFLTEYLAVVFVDLETHRYQYYSRSAELADDLQEGDFFERFAEDALQYAVREDREKLAQGLARETLLQKIDSREKHLLEFRLSGSDGPVWHEIRLISGEAGPQGQYAVLGVRDIDDEKRKADELARTEREKEKLNQIANALAGIFDSLYYINLEDNSFIEFSSTDQYKKIRTMDSGDNFFLVAKPLLSRFIHREDTASIVCLYDKAEMLKAPSGQQGKLHHQVSVRDPGYRHFLPGRAPGDPGREPRAGQHQRFGTGEEHRAKAAGNRPAEHDLFSNRRAAGRAL